MAIRLLTNVKNTRSVSVVARIHIEGSPPHQAVLAS